MLRRKFATKMVMLLHTPVPIMMVLIPLLNFLAREMTLMVLKISSQQITRIDSREQSNAQKMTELARMRSLLKMLLLLVALTLRMMEQRAITLLSVRTLTQRLSISSTKRATRSLHAPTSDVDTIHPTKSMQAATISGLTLRRMMLASTYWEWNGATTLSARRASAPMRIRSVDARSDRLVRSYMQLRHSMVTVK